MWKSFNKIVVLVILSLCYSCFYDHIPSHTTGLVIDNATGLPINGAVVNDLKSGNSARTDENGQFDVQGIVPKQKIEVFAEGYLPFSIEITAVSKWGRYYSKSYSIPDRNYMNESKHEIIEPDSHSFSVIDGSSLILRLRKK